jgi:hypothetical protein
LVIAEPHLKPFSKGHHHGPFGPGVVDVTVVVEAYVGWAYARLPLTDGVGMRTDAEDLLVLTGKTYVGISKSHRLSLSLLQ